MRAVIYDSFGRPTDVVRCVQQPDPKPSPGQVVVALEAAAIHPADLLTLEGRYLARPSFPGAVPGQEGVGRVVDAGQGVTMKVGTRVLLPMGCGTWRDRIVTAARNVVALPDEGDPAQLAMAVVNPATAWLMLTDLAKPHLRAGEWIIQNASNGGVGQLVCQFARELDLRTVNIVRREAARKMVDAAGGDVVLVDGPDLARQVRRMTQGAQIRLALDAVGGRASQRISACLATGGHLVSYGALSGEACRVHPNELIFRDIDLRGFWLSTWLRKVHPEKHRELIAPIVQRIVRGEIGVPVTAQYPLSRVEEAVAHAARHGRDGKVVLLGEAFSA